MTSKAVGLIETIGLAAALEAADAAAKAANVKLLGYENTKGGGRITVKFVGDVGAVKAAVAAGSAAALRVGQVETCLVIPRPHAEIEFLIGQIDRGASAAEKPEPAAKKVQPAAVAKKVTPARAKKSKPASAARSKPAARSSSKPKPAAPEEQAPLPTEPEAPPPATPVEPESPAPPAPVQPEDSTSAE